MYSGLNAMPKPGAVKIQHTILSILRQRQDGQTEAVMGVAAVSLHVAIFYKVLCNNPGGSS